ERIRRIRQVGKDHHFTLVCAGFSQLGQFVLVSNPTFRLVKSATPGPYTFILPATREVPRKMAHPKKHTVGVRIPDHRVAPALVEALGEPIVSSTLLLPEQEDPPTEDGWSRTCWESRSRRSSIPGRWAPSRPPSSTSPGTSW